MYNHVCEDWSYGGTVTKVLVVSHQSHEELFDELNANKQKLPLYGRRC